MLKRNIKEEERIERIIRGLIKLPENKRCINCNSLGPQYVCTTFWTFVCTNCSGVHREFTHRVKSVSMAKFSADEAASLQAGGNEQARKTYFKTWDPQRNSFPDSSNLHRLREFIRHVYVDQKYSGERNNEKVSLGKTGAKDDYSVQQSSENFNRVAREYFFKYRTSEKTDQARRDDSYDRCSYENFSPMNRDRTLRYYIEERSSPQYRQENLRSASRRRRPAHFEIVDDRFREDGVRSRRQLESNRLSDADSRPQSSSISQKGRSKTCPPPVHPVKDILGDNVPPLKLGELPKANDMKNIEFSTQVQTAASSTSPGSTDKKEKDHTVNALNLIDFDANPEPPTTTAAVQGQQNIPSCDGGNISTPTSTNENASNTLDINSMDFLLFELSDPAVAPLGSTSEQPPAGDTPLAATEDSLNTETAITPASTTNASLDPNFIGTTNASPVQNAPVLTHASSLPVVSVTQAQQLPATYQNQSFAVSPGNGSSTSLRTSSSAQSLDKQPFASELAHIKGPPPNVSSEISSQDVSNFAQDRSSGNESASTGRKELPADIFTASHLPFAAAAPGWQFRPRYEMGYGTMVSCNSVKSRNPFDLGDDGIQFQAAAFPSMSSFQGALPNTSASPGSWPQQLPHSLNNNSQGMSYQMVPPGVYMGQQLANNMMPSIAQTINNAGDNDDAFASLNPILHSSVSKPTSAGPTSYPSTTANPFG